MLIALCDTNLDYGKYLSSQIHNLSSAALTPIEVKMFSSAEEMVSAISRWEEYDAIFMEIGNNTHQHFELAKKLRNQHQHLAIVFLATDDSYVLKGYSVPIFRYLIKHDIGTRLKECLQSLLKKYKATYSIIHLREYGAYQDIRSDAIEYITAFGKLSIVTFWQECYQTMELMVSLDHLEGKLKPYRFIRIQRGFLVNSQYIIKLSNHKAYMRSGITLNTSRSGYGAIKTEFEILRASM